MKVLAVSGSLRERSSNTSVLRALSILAPAGTAVGIPAPLDALPFLNPDGEESDLPRSVRGWRVRIASTRMASPGC